ncbi:MAG: PAS domain-containing protein [Kiritimatiellales bacterium]
MKKKTQFAPAERAPQKEIIQLYEKLAALPLLCDFMNTVPNVMVVLNKCRQIVFGNQAFAELTGAEDPSAVIGKHRCALLPCPYRHALGKRPGEALRCIHTDTGEDCGTTLFCRSCGAVNAILNSQINGRGDIQECRLICGTIGRPETALDLRVWTRQIEVDSERLTVFSVMDISHEKRRKELEYIFFHDVLNNASGVCGLATLLNETVPPPEKTKEIAGLITRASTQLIDEISLQRLLTAAESGDLKVYPQEIDTADICAKAVQTIETLPAAKGKKSSIKALKTFGLSPIRYCSITS